MYCIGAVSSITSRTNGGREVYPAIQRLSTQRKGPVPLEGDGAVENRDPDALELELEPDLVAPPELARRIELKRAAPVARARVEGIDIQSIIVISVWLLVIILLNPK